MKEMEWIRVLFEIVRFTLWKLKSVYHLWCGDPCHLVNNKGGGEKDVGYRETTPLVCMYILFPPYITM